jgi:hypothetical protein
MASRHSLGSKRLGLLKRLRRKEEGSASNNTVRVTQTSGIKNLDHDSLSPRSYLSVGALTSSCQVSYCHTLICLILLTIFC